MERLIQAQPHSLLCSVLRGLRSAQGRGGQGGHSQKMVHLGGFFTKTWLYMVNFSHRGGQFLSSAKSCIALSEQQCLGAAVGWVHVWGWHRTALAGSSLQSGTRFRPFSLTVTLEPGWGGWNPARREERGNCCSKSLLCFPRPEPGWCSGMLCPPYITLPQPSGSHCSL